MDIAAAKQAVIDAGAELVKEGLIQRTWGNVSCRVSDTQFVITPSGRDYLSLTPEDIVLVNISDLSYEGDVKPSSEKGIHAACYALRPEVNFVIHTHQTYASLIGLTGLDINDITGDAAEVIGTNVPLASYGLPGTKKLRKGVIAALRRSDSRAVLMHHHGALCVGRDAADAFAVANALETLCEARISERFTALTGRAAEGFRSLAEYVAQTLQERTCADELDAYDSVRSFGAVEMTPVSGGDTLCVELESGLPLDPSQPCPDTAVLHAEIYKKRSDVQAICHSKEEATLAVSRAGTTIKPFLDDFAQIVGLTLRTAAYDPNDQLRSARRVIKKMRGRDAVMLDHNGAICVGKDEDEARAVKLVAEKGCKAFVTADLYGKKKAAINTAESLLMRVVYKAKYAKKK